MRFRWECLALTNCMMKCDTACHVHHVHHAHKHTNTHTHKHTSTHTHTHTHTYRNILKFSQYHPNFNEGFPKGGDGGPTFEKIPKLSRIFSLRAYLSKPVFCMARHGMARYIASWTVNSISCTSGQGVVPTILLLSLLGRTSHRTGQSRWMVSQMQGKESYRNI